MSMRSVLRNCQCLRFSGTAGAKCGKSVRPGIPDICTAKPRGRQFGSPCKAQEGPEYFSASTSKEEWLKVDEKVNKYPSLRTFKAIGSADDNSEEFVNDMVQAVEEAGNQAVLIKDQVRQRPSKNGRYLSITVHKVNVESGEQVYGIYEAIRSQCGKRLKFII